MKAIIRHIKTYILRGILVSIPFALTFFVIRLLYVTIDRRIMGILNQFIGFKIPGLGILILLALLYILGIVGSNVVGRYFLGLVERIAKRIPIINTTYQVGKIVKIACSELFDNHIILIP